MPPEQQRLQHHGLDATWGCSRSHFHTERVPVGLPDRAMQASRRRWPVQLHNGVACCPCVLMQALDRQVRWFFDTQVGECRRFKYGGCRGNANNFETQVSSVPLCVHTRFSDARVHCSGCVHRRLPAKSVPAPARRRPWRRPHRAILLQRRDGRLLQLPVRVLQRAA